jgi:hypothetical protein
MALSSSLPPPPPRLPATSILSVALAAALFFSARSLARTPAIVNVLVRDEAVPPQGFKERVPQSLRSAAREVAHKGQDALRSGHRCQHMTGPGSGCTRDSQGTMHAPWVNRSVVAHGRQGFCEVTTFEVQGCHMAPKGIFPRASSAHECRQLCIRCPLCQYVSFSLRLRDCSWFQSCNLSRLLGGRGRTGHVTYKVRQTDSVLEALDPPQLITRGLCARAAMDDGKTCQSGAKGGWVLPTDSMNNWSKAMQECHNRCAACHSCHYFSASASSRRCHWYAQCPPGQLLIIPNGYFTVSMRVVAVTLRAPSSPWLRIALDTVRLGPQPLVNDYFYTRFHVQPLTNWMSDPNAPMWFGGMYHLFAQYNPVGDQFGAGWMHW